MRTFLEGKLFPDAIAHASLFNAREIVKSVQLLSVVPNVIADVGNKDVI